MAPHLFTRLSFLGFAAALPVAICGISANAAVFVQPTSAELSGTTASGVHWTEVATGTYLPVTGTSPAAGSPGAVVFFNTLTGQIQIDPKGLRLTTVIITYGPDTTNISSSTSGPFVYPSGTAANAISSTTGVPKTFPAVTAVTGLAPTTFAARVGMVIGPPLGPSLASSGDVGNIASTTGFWDQPWAFPIELVDSDSIGTMTLTNFYTVGQTTNPNINKLGYGNGRATFQYSADGIVGNQVGAVIPVTAVSPIPEPGSHLAVAGLLAGGLVLRRRTGRRSRP